MPLVAPDTRVPSKPKGSCYSFVCDWLRSGLGPGQSEQQIYCLACPLSPPMQIESPAKHWVAASQRHVRCNCITSCSQDWASTSQATLSACADIQPRASLQLWPKEALHNLLHMHL